MNHDVTETESKISDPMSDTQTDLSEKVRTQLSLEERQRRWVKLVAQVASWRLKNDPVHASQTNRSVSMAEVVRVALDEQITLPITVETMDANAETHRMLGRSRERKPHGDDPENYPFHPGEKIREGQLKDGRRLEIVDAMRDVSLYGRVEGQMNPLDEIPDTRLRREHLTE